MADVSELFDANVWRPVDGFTAPRRQAADAALLQRAPGRALVRRVGQAHEGIDTVRGHQLARLAAERGVGREQDARAQAHRPHPVVGRRFGHGRGRERAQRFVGRSLEVLVEGPSRTDPTRLRGRSRHGKAVNFTGLAQSGETVQVEILSASSQTLAGEESLLTRALA